jgi:hypothetical protein
MYPPTPADARGSASEQKGCEHKNHPQQQQLPWCFPIREGPFEQKESQEQEQQQQEETRGKSN